MHTGTHLHFKGRCSEAFRLYAETFDGRIEFSMTYGEAPGAEKVPAEMRGQIIHARLSLGNGQYVLGMDASPDRYHAPQGFNVMADVETPADAERIFNRLAEGGTVTMPFGETFWAQRFGMLTDRFGIPWMINCAKPPEASKAARRA
jgi:PhnB protein